MSTSQEPADRDAERQVWGQAVEVLRETGRTPRQLLDERAELIAALRNLQDEQNGPPLVQHRQSWERAMRRGDNIVDRCVTQ